MSSSRVGHGGGREEQGGAWKGEELGGGGRSWVVVKAMESAKEHNEVSVTLKWVRMHPLSKDLVDVVSSRACQRVEVGAQFAGLVWHSDLPTCCLGPIV